VESSDQSVEFPRKGFLRRAVRWRLERRRSPRMGLVGARVGGLARLAGPKTRHAATEDDQPDSRAAPSATEGVVLLCWLICSKQSRRRF
jgi:hypothetical protein